MRISLLSTILSCGLIANAHAAEFGTAEEAQALVKKAVSYIQSVGAQKAYADITSKKQDFLDRDLYIAVIGFDGTIIAHGVNEKLPGKNMLDLKDTDGKFFIREIVDKAKTQNSLTVDYKFTEPTTKKVLPKTMFCDRLNETVVCAGIYKH